VGVQVTRPLLQPSAGGTLSDVRGTDWTRAALAASLAVALVAAVFALLYPNLWYGEHDVSDIVIIQGHAQTMAAGQEPYRDFAFEYPPIAAWLFAAPGHSDSYAAFTTWFSFMMFLFALATAAVVAATAARLWPEGLKPYLTAILFAGALAAIGAIVYNRFDMAVALAGTLAMFFAARRQVVLAAAVLGAGFALKLTPAVLLPLVLLLAPSWRRGLAAAGSFVLVAAAPFIPYLIMAPAGVWHLFTYHMERPLQLESVLGTPFLLGQTMRLVWVDVITSFGSQGIAATGATTAASLSTWLTLAAVLAVYGLILRRRRLFVTRPQLLPLAFLAVVLSTMVFGKVLSPQFFIWLVPLAALVTLEEPLLGALTFGTLMLTQINFPGKYWFLVYLEPNAIHWLAARNALLVLTFGVALWRLARLRDARMGHLVRPPGRRALLEERRAGSATDQGA
jgi:hypothetical protein